MRDWLRHAFSIPAAEDFCPTQAQRALVERVVRLTLDKGLETPALLLLETVRPLHRVSSQLLLFFAPILALLALDAAGAEFSRLLEHPGSVEFLASELERQSHARTATRDSQMAPPADTLAGEDAP